MNLIQMLLLSFAINGLFFVFAAFFRTDVFTDITYSLSFILIALVLFAGVPIHTPLVFLVTGMVVLWGIRLGMYLLYRILHIKVDHRFDDKRDSVVKFGIFWLFQAFTVWVVLFPVYGILSLPEHDTVPLFLIVLSVAGFLCGLVIETVADIQKYRFKMNPENRGKFMATGIWQYSRHPNYFGEILVWWSISIPGVFLFHGFEYLYFLGPLYITLMLLFVSGIPLLEKSADEKWGNDESYRRYKKETSLLVPLPRRKG